MPAHQELEHIYLKVPHLMLMEEAGKEMLHEAQGLVTVVEASTPLAATFEVKVHMRSPQRMLVVGCLVVQLKMERQLCMAPHQL